ncbi:MAG: 4-hydroxythreonine-4-phosphate dehydrogenase PdxA [candidate division WOR-3 bacterium]|nr:4-hydroxythreonine-4-phosphate dehydrogenase PdxA [candidate division WOR-3 bacterium]MCX7757893.1 4-hydroxythreonine-4-phosphate dehydrogenase PdxA [candidate division WOR-3 bacterium]MDW7987348.1 4-hydroxythreonine-4-phosphate dehydrogenase PdxA [candidate division WOR-3 bacterium]
MLGITIGDPAGIGPEVVLKSLSFLSQKSSPKIIKNFIVIGNRKLLKQAYKKFINTHPAFNFDELFVADAFEDFSFNYGVVQKQCGVATMLQLNFATYLLKTKQINAVITAPVSKEALRLAGFPFEGQTEYFAKEFGVENYGMLIWTEKVKIILVTIHMPLSDVSDLLTSQNIFQKILLLNHYLKTAENISRPRIGVLAFNPHGFEFTKGEEQKILSAIKKAQAKKINALGPIPADSAFLPNNKYRFDGYVAMYHDQGLLAAKLISWGGGVNLTWGLPFIRTSPLHGVAFDIAGKNIANINSMVNALKLAQKLSTK